MNNSELCVPAGALAESGEGGESLAPMEGDQVEVMIGGRVTRTEGGNLYIQPETANGQPIPQQGEKSLEEEGEELRALSGGGGGGGSYALVIVFLLLLLRLGEPRSVMAAGALEFAQECVCSETTVSNYVAHVTGRQVFSIEIDNYSGGTLYLMVFDSATNQLAGSTAFKATPVAVSTGTTSFKEWAAYGAPFDRGVNVCLSTTPRSLTNASSGGIVTVVSSPRK